MVIRNGLALAKLHEIDGEALSFARTVSLSLFLAIALDESPDGTNLDWCSGATTAFALLITNFRHSCHHIKKALNSSGRWASVRNTLGMKPAFSCTSRMRARISSGRSARLGTGYRLIARAMTGPVDGLAERVRTSAVRSPTRRRRRHRKSAVPSARRDTCAPSDPQGSVDSR